VLFAQYEPINMATLRRICRLHHGKESQQQGQSSEQAAHRCFSGCPDLISGGKKMEASVLRHTLLLSYSESRTCRSSTEIFGIQPEGEKM
jgi:hypothetical protein